MADWREIGFDAGRFDAAMFALCRAVPYLDHLLDFIDTTHEPAHGEEAVRRWHRALARDGHFDIWLHDRTLRLRSGRAVMLADKTAFFGVQGRPDLILASGRLGYGHPLTAVVLPRQRAVLRVMGDAFAVTGRQAARAVALFAAHGAECWAETLTAPVPRRLLVTGEANYAHHMWNQLGAIDALRRDGIALDIAATHQPVALIADIFAGPTRPRVTPMRPEALEALDPTQVLPYPAGGRLVVSAVRDRIQALAVERAPAAARQFLAAMRAAGRRPVWLGLRSRRIPLNQTEALAELASALLRDGRFAIVLDGYSRGQDFADNPAYDKTYAEMMIAEETAIAARVTAEIGRRCGAGAPAMVLSTVGWPLLHALFVAGQCAAYFANHGTLQHKLGYFTQVPGLVHGNPAILAMDRAATEVWAIHDPGLAEYVDPSLVEDAPGPDGRAMQTGNDYRFTDLPRLVAGFRAFLQRVGVG